MNIKENASKLGNGILDISPRNVGKALVSPFTFLNRKKNERIQKAADETSEALAAAMSIAITNAMINPAAVDFTVVEKVQNQDA